MLDALSDHLPLLNVLLSAAMVAIWVIYLQIFLSNHRRQSRSVIHIDLGGTEGPRARCLVTNLSSGALYVQGIVADLGYRGHTSRVVVTDRDEIAEDGAEDPLSRTNRGVLQPGETQVIGSLDDLIHRARIRLNEEWTFDGVDSLTITVVAISGQIERIVGAAKEFQIEHRPEGGGKAWFTACAVLTRQLPPVHTRDEFDALLSEHTYH